MRQLKVFSIWLTAVLMSVLMIGCGCNGKCKNKESSTTTTQLNRPTVTFVAPFNTETGVPINWPITAVFSEAMDPATIGITTFTVTGPDLAPVIGTLSYDTTDHTAIFTPDSDLLPNTGYVATITLGAKNPAGTSLVLPFVWVFTTAVTPDTTKPLVTFVTPLDGATGVPISTSVTAMFSEVMSAVGYTSPYPFILQQGATLIPGIISYLGYTATFTPSSPLVADTTYTATITGGIDGARDLAGNTLGSDYVWSFKTAATPDTRPTVILVNPLNGATGVPINTAVNATFSKAMFPPTINTANFWLTSPGPTAVNGTVIYNLLTDIATFTPLSPLAISTKYTATITIGALDLAGNSMLNNYVWSFTTAAAIKIGPEPVALGAVANFAIIAGGGISDVPTSAITGDIGVSPASGAFITGFSVPATCPEINGTVYAVDAAGPACAAIDPVALTAAKAALTFAYNDAAGRTLPAPAAVSGDQGGLTLYPGIYKSTSTLLIQNGNLTLDAQGDANAVWIFQIASALTTIGCGASVPCTTGGNVMLINGANAANVFWQVGTAATIGQYTAFNGTILAHDDISIGTGAQIHGRLLSGAQPSGAGAVTLIQDTIIIP